MDSDTEPPDWRSAGETQRIPATPPATPPPIPPAVPPAVAWREPPLLDPETSPVAPAGWSTPAPPPSNAAPSRGRGRGFLALLLAALLGAGIGTTATFVSLDRNRNVGLLSTAPVIKVNGGSSEPVAAVAKAVTPSIVRIDVSEQGGLGTGTGSGVIYRSDGYIITNNHVTEGTSDIEVTLASGQRLSARLVGSAAPTADIAVVKVDAAGLPAARLGSTHTIEVGDLAVAIGSPFGLQGTVTAGVVSALHRNINLGPGERFADAIQTDAPINPGNSGGALATAKGQVIGINTAIVGGTGGNVGVGFAIPIEIAKRVADQIISSGHAALPFIGISGQNLPPDRGALVQEVVNGGPAAGAGLKPGDIIVALGGQKITSMDGLIATLIQRQVGETVEVVYLRNGQRHTTQVKLAARPQGS